jgi:hypothetical protein
VDCFAFLKGLGTTPIETAWPCGSIALRQQPERLIQSPDCPEPIRSQTRARFLESDVALPRSLTVSENS